MSNLICKEEIAEMPKTINYKQIADMLKISYPTVLRIISQNKDNMPKPCAIKKSGREIVYLEHEIKEWIEKNLERILNKKLRAKISVAANDELTGTPITPLSFMQGKFASKSSQNKSRFKRLASSTIRPETVKVITPYNNYGEYHEKFL